MLVIQVFFDYTSICCFDPQNPSIVKISLTFQFAYRGSFNPPPDSQAVWAASELYFATAQNSLNAA